MLAKPFEKAICVWVGLGFPRQLNTVIDAYQFVSECCGNSLEQKPQFVPARRLWPGT